MQSTAGGRLGVSSIAGNTGGQTENTGSERLDAVAAHQAVLNSALEVLLKDLDQYASLCDSLSNIIGEKAEGEVTTELQGAAPDPRRNRNRLIALSKLWENVAKAAELEEAGSESAVELASDYEAVSRLASGLSGAGRIVGETSGQPSIPRLRSVILLPSSWGDDVLQCVVAWSHGGPASDDSAETKELYRHLKQEFEHKGTRCLTVAVEFDDSDSEENDVEDEPGAQASLSTATEAAMDSTGDVSLYQFYKNRRSVDMGECGRLIPQSKVALAKSTATDNKDEDLDMTSS